MQLLECRLYRFFSVSPDITVQWQTVVVVDIIWWYTVVYGSTNQYTVVHVGTLHLRLLVIIIVLTDGLIFGEQVVENT